MQDLYGGSSLSRRTALLQDEGSRDRRMRQIRLSIAVAVVSAGSSFQFGFGTAELNNLESLAPESLKKAGSAMSLLKWSTVVSGFALGGFLGSMAVPLLSHCFGRKTILLANNVLVFASSGLLMGGKAWSVLFLGRILIGMVAGIATGVVPLYFAEISSARARGAVGTAHQLGITIGIVVAQGVTTPSLGLLGDADQWRYAFLVPIFCALLECIVLPFCTESPAYVYR